MLIALNCKEGKIFAVSCSFLSAESFELTNLNRLISYLFLKKKLKEISISQKTLLTGKQEVK